MAKMNIAAIVLAAGQSQRFGEVNKLLAMYRGVPLIDHCLDTVLSHQFSDRIIVNGFESDIIEAHVKGLPVRTVVNQDFAKGLGSSLAVGVKALNSDCDAFMVFLADMPNISPDTIAVLIEVYESKQSDFSIVRPMYEGRPGHPVLFARAHASEIQELADDKGAATIIKKHKTSTLNVEVSSAGIIRDVDLISDLI